MVDWPWAMGMWTALCQLKRRTTITPQERLHTAFALSESEQGLKISSLSSHLNALTPVLPKGHHQVLMKEGLWLWLPCTWVLRESRLKTNLSSLFQTGCWLPQKAFSSTTLKYLALSMCHTTVKPRYHWGLKNKGLKRKKNCIKGLSQSPHCRSPFTELPFHP